MSSSYQFPQANKSAYDTDGAEGYLEPVRISSATPAPHQPSVDITAMGEPEYRPYAGSYSAAPAGNVQNDQEKSRATSKDHKRSMSKGNEFADDGDMLGIAEMSHLRACRLCTYLMIRILQIVLAIACLGLMANSRTKAGSDLGGIVPNTTIVFYVVGGVTAVVAAVSIALNLFRRTRVYIRTSRLEWSSLVLNSLIFAMWMILVLIDVVAVDCSTKDGGSWCKKMKVGLAMALISAMLIS
ncbi:hypothetical protein DL89DRAFT_293724 [Linderina pennispora]|uniref:MARVEL domain-containing protein n=1 Tax=Linderina pennispora TaxID=61395 RepID=A0A1Y1W4K4_9FUNG|nr:uncharacterized protein DL89DRAFT_293724 [Linderina pennispora]ORX68469.1 hypothetical protein DL89DRAFT_293724 [Linderina pennispora]